MSLTQDDLTAVRDVVLEALDIAVNPRLDRLENRMDGLETQGGSLETRMSGIEVEVKGLKAEQFETNRRLSAIETKLEDIDECRNRQSTRLM